MFSKFSSTHAFDNFSSALTYNDMKMQHHQCQQQQLNGNCGENSVPSFYLCDTLMMMFVFPQKRLPACKMLLLICIALY